MSSRSPSVYTLVIVESPVKAKTIRNYLGDGYEVDSSNGHVRDLPKKELSIDIEKGFQPHYQIKPEKMQLVNRLKESAAHADRVLLASDQDREGEAIAFELKESLELDDNKTDRIVFREITRNAIRKAVSAPRKIDMDLVYAQQARRLLDRIVGYSISPILWKKIKPGLSAGRVQSVAVRMVVERERAIRKFVPLCSYPVTATFTLQKGRTLLEGVLKKPLSTYEEAYEMVSKSKKALFSVEKVEKRVGSENPSPPFDTPSLQQSASRQLGYSVTRTMVLAQRLYEEGHITYMRTDALTLSEQVLSQAQALIKKKYGAAYHHQRHYTTKTKGAQEAHEAIRPTDLSKEIVSKEQDLQKLYTLIRQRTLASQMAPTQVEHTQVLIKMDSAKHAFIAKGEVIVFDGFLAAYGGQKATKALPSITEGTPISLKQLEAREQYSRPPKARFTEASLVKELKERGIGRPSTYAPIIKTIQDRQYVVHESRPGTKRLCKVITLKEGAVKETEEEKVVGAEKNKLFPTDVALSVTDFLTQNFKEVTDYEFTAHMEKELDKIAHKENVWNQMLERFYNDLSPQLETAEKTNTGVQLVRLLGKDPKSGKNIYARFTKRHGPLVHMGELDDEEKPRFASLRPGQMLEDITLEEALDLFILPRRVGTFEDEEIVAQIGRFGPYLRHNGAFYSVGQEHSVYTIGAKEAIEVIKAKRIATAKSILKTFPEDETLQVRIGRFGPYIKAGKKTVRLDKKIDPKSLTFEQCQKIVQEAPEKPKRNFSKKK